MVSEVPVQIYTPAIDVPHYFTGIITFFTGHSGDFLYFFQSVVGIIIAICIPLTVFFLILLVIVVENLKRVRELEDKKYNTPAEPAYIEEKVDAELANRWKKVVEHVDSPNPNDWKQAIIEADILLDQLVTKLGYRGESLGEKLKRTVRGDFKTRDQAWDAHMVRNRIAHDGSAYELNQLEAKRVISLYRQVFDEFYHISG